MPFTDKVILITGGNSGIGAACAEYFAKEGALLALVGRRMEKFESVIEKIQSFGVEAEPLVILADITVDAERIINETVEKFGRLDILINSAGMLIGDNLMDMKMEDYDSMMATVRGTVEVTKLAVPHLIENKGNIVVISSALGIIMTPDSIGYGICKAMLIHFTKCLSMELAGKGVRVNAISPGVIDTDFHANSGITGDQYADFCESVSQLHPIQRIGNTDDCVNAIAFLADDTAKFVTGLNLPIDGALSIKGVF